MAKRTSVKDVKEMGDLNDLESLVKDKRNDKRSDAKKERRNRHYVKVLIKHPARSPSSKNAHACFSFQTET